MRLVRRRPLRRVALRPHRLSVQAAALSRPLHRRWRLASGDSAPSVRRSVDRVTNVQLSQPSGRLPVAQRCSPIVEEHVAGAGRGVLLPHVSRAVFKQQGFGRRRFCPRLGVRFRLPSLLDRRFEKPLPHCVHILTRRRCLARLVVITGGKKHS